MRTWTSAVSGDMFNVNANSKSALSSNLITVFENLGQPTLMRMRGSVLLFTVDGAAADDAAIGMGICLANGLASTAAVLPGPITNSEFPWIWHTFTMMRHQTAADARTPLINTQRIEIDSKAMRKISPEMELFFMVELLNTAGTLDILIAPNFRVLLQS